MDHDRRASTWRTFAADDWLVLGCLGALLGLTLFFIHVPANIWARNTTEFHSRFAAFLPLSLSLTVMGFVGALVILWSVPTRARAVLASLLGAVAIAGWFYAFLLASNMSVLDGLDRPEDFETALGVWELPLAGIVCAFIATGVARIRRATIAGLLTLNIGLAGVTTATVGAARNPRMRAPVVQDAGSESVFRFSPRENVLIVLLDSLQSDLAAQILRRDPALKSAFDGFHFYRDTLGVAPTTFLSLPAIHAGIAYSGHRSLGGYFEESIRFRSFMTRFADAGYETTLVNPADGVCPDGIRTCVTSSQLLRSDIAQRRREFVRLLDLSLFRMSPIWLKRHIHDGGNWLLAEWIFVSEDVGRVIEHNAILDAIARRVTVSEGDPTLKFVHSLATHTPFVLHDDCRTVNKRNSPSSAVPQSRCALLAVARILDALKAANVYDRTEILIMADHGMGRPSRYARRRSKKDRSWPARVGYANPVFLLKPRGDRGTLKEEKAPVYLPDVAATLCRSSGACSVPSGVPAGDAPSGRVRHFFDYAWRHEFWRLRDIPHVTTYEVRGPLWQDSSWRKIDDDSGQPRNEQPRTNGSSGVSPEAPP